MIAYITLMIKARVSSEKKKKKNERERESDAPYSGKKCLLSAMYF